MTDFRCSVNGGVVIRAVSGEGPPQKAITAICSPIALEPKLPMAEHQKCNQRRGWALTHVKIGYAWLTLTGNVANMGAGGMDTPYQYYVESPTGETG